MIIDTTTHNKIYNPASAQGQWFNHRWGQREYPLLELSEDHVHSVIKKFPQEYILLRSIYGDPASFTHLPLLCEHYKNNLEIHTYGMFSPEQIKIINDSQAIVKVFIDGWGESFGKVHLGACLETIKNTIENVVRCTVVYYTYKHNESDILDFIYYCKRHNINIILEPGDIHDEHCQSIISAQCEWLYDVLPSDICSEGAMLFSEIDDFIKNNTFSNDRSLVKHIFTYNSLRTFVNRPKDKGILDKPLVPKYFPDPELHIKFKRQGFDESEKMITPHGYYFESCDLGSMFMMFLCNDWKFESKDFKNYNEFMLYLLFVVQHLNSMEFKDVIDL